MRGMTPSLMTPSLMTMSLMIPSLMILGGLVACDPGEHSPAPSVPVAAPAATRPAAVPPAPQDAPVPGMAHDVGPSGAEGRTARHQAVLDVLGDGRSASALPVAATEPDRAFDPELAEKLAPSPVVLDRLLRDVPVVRQGAQKVEGPLDPLVVRRVVRAHTNDLRYCYNGGLVGDPGLAGRVVVDFEILTTGMVGESKLTSTTLSDRKVGECVVVATRRWQFPAPATVVRVTFPFEFAPSG